MCNVGFVRRQLLLLLRRKSEGRHLLFQRFCSNISAKKDADHEDQVSQSPLIAEDDYFGVSIPEGDWSVQRNSSLSKDDIFIKYQVDCLTELEKDKMHRVNMPFGTVSFDTISDVKHQIETREMFSERNFNRGVEEKILDRMARVSDETEADSSGEKYYISFLDQFKKDSKHGTTESNKSVSDAQVKEHKSRAQKKELRTVDSFPEKTIDSFKRTAAHEHHGNIVSRKTSQCHFDQPAKVEYGDLAISNKEGSNEKRDDSTTDLNFIDQQYIQQDVLRTNSKNSNRLNLKILQKFHPEEATPELDPDMLVAYTDKVTCSESTEQDITSSHQSFTKAHQEHASPTQKLKQLESDNNFKRKASGKKNGSQRRQKHENLTPELQNLETTGNMRTKSKDMNFIDQQFFGEYLSEDQSSMKTSVDNDDKDPKSDLNFIDEEYFKETVSISAKKTNKLSTSDHRKLEEEKVLTSDHRKLEEEKVPTLDHRKFEKEKEVTSDHRKFQKEKIVKDVHKYPENKKNSKRNNQNDEENHLSQILQGNVMDRLERDAIVKRKRALLETKKTKESEDVMDTAYGTVQMLRNKQGRNLEGGAPLRDSEGMKIMKTTVPQLYKMTSVEIVNMITRHILYDSDDVVAIYKPYGLPSHGGPGVAISVAHLMDQISESLGERQNPLHMVHRLDKDTTGVMLLARTKHMAAQLAKAFAERTVVKKYWAITKGIPHPKEGIIDIPMMEGSVDGKKRMVLKPNFLPDGRIATKSSVKTFKAVTHYKVISSRDNTALVECLPLTGVRHQLRAHLSFGLNTPVLGDHKYSNLLNFAPQKLDSTTLRKLGVQQSKVRHIPLHLHAMSILIPEFLDGRNLFVTSNLPKHFCRSMRNLKLKPAGDKQ
ncbi:uncharacterized protein LOC110455352 [Mizuhopecten yessoensis]|nr:uncharacterized protein LOC110455352 [Mizuhopecten yessoensis]